MKSKVFCKIVDITRNISNTSENKIDLCLLFVNTMLLDLYRYLCQKIYIPFNYQVFVFSVCIIFWLKCTSGGHMIA
jgi:hypothetical protein